MGWVTPPRALTSRSLLVLASLTVIGAGLALLVLALKRWRKHNQVTRLRGIVDLADRETGETCTLLLHRFPHGVGITRHPLELVALEPARGRAATIAALLPGVAGPLLAYENPTEGRQHIPLHNGDKVVINQSVELHFRRAR